MVTSLVVTARQSEPSSASRFCRLVLGPCGLLAGMLVLASPSCTVMADVAETPLESRIFVLHSPHLEQSLRTPVLCSHSGLVTAVHGLESRHRTTSQPVLLMKASYAQLPAEV